MSRTPLEDFFRNPEQAGFAISPDGAHLSVLRPWKNRLNVHVEPVSGGEARRLTSDTERDIHSYGWANPTTILYMQDAGGDENDHAYAVDISGGEPRDLTPFENVKVTLVDLLEDDDEHVLLAMNRRVAELFDVWRANLATGELTMVAENPGSITSWTTDNSGRVRAGTATDGVNSQIMTRPDEDSPFTPVVTTNFRTLIAPLFFTFDDQKLVVSSNLDRERMAICTLDPTTGDEGELIYEHDSADVDTLLRSRKRKTFTGVHVETDRSEYHFFDDARRELQERLEAQLPGTDVHVVDTDRDETTVIVRTHSDRSLGAYYVADANGENLRKLADLSPWLDAEKMSEMSPVRFAARDGLELNGYLTLPREGSAPYPTVLNVHGGPWARDSWGFNPEVQFLASRGYAVLQVNFRGSTGFGRAFWEASFHQWGRAMQDDLTDAVGWLSAEGVADEDRVAIYGGSYGGYATLAGLAFTPDVYACGIDYVGVSNIFTLLETIPPYWEPMREMMYEMIGHPERDEDLLRAASPLFHADKITAPLFVAQGANDPRVKQAESDQIVEALRARRVDVDYLVKDNEGHGFQNEENKFEFYRKMESFLETHLAGGGRG